MREYAIHSMGETITEITGGDTIVSKLSHSCDEGFLISADDDHHREQLIRSLQSFSRQGDTMGHVWSLIADYAATQCTLAEQERLDKEMEAYLNSDDTYHG